MAKRKLLTTRLGAENFVEASFCHEGKIKIASVHLDQVSGSEDDFSRRMIKDLLVEGCLAAYSVIDCLGVSSNRWWLTYAIWVSTSSTVGSEAMSTS